MRDLTLPSLNRFASDYLEGRIEVEDYFHYDLTNENLYKNRYEELMRRAFNRDELANAIEQYMEWLPESKEVIRNLDDLRKNDSVVVIGGQQAGLLTGPLYTIHKVVSIIKLAEEQEKALNKRVIPVFWIAGEDHDLAEVNHVYVTKDRKPVKKTFPSYQLYKTMVSHVQLDRELIEKWFEEVLQTYGETTFTEKIRKQITNLINQSNTYVDFFTALIHEWFSQYGLLLIDSADKNFRTLQSTHFTEMIHKNEQLTKSVLHQQSLLQAKGYSRMIDIDENAVNLFYYDTHKMDRQLLTREGHSFKSAKGDSPLTKEQLLTIAKEQPQQLSNNVVTRPIMQELLFPVLAFISGPGEIAYWAELKKGFELFSIKMPPIVPRLTITFVERGIATDLAEVKLELADALTGGCKQATEAYLQSVKDETLEHLLLELKRNLQESHSKLMEHVTKEDKGIEAIMQKNLFFIQQQIEYIDKKIAERTRMRHEVIVGKFDRISLSLQPMQSPQERIWNIFYYVNKYGPDFIQEIMKLEYVFNHKHKAIFL